MAFPMAQGDGDDKKKKTKGKELYYKYEREEVAYYRDRTDFKFPEPIVAPVEEVENILPQGSSLAHLFNGGNKTYIDADYRLGEMVEKHKEILSNIKKVEGYRVQIYASGGRQGAWQQKKLVMGQYPDVPSYLDFKSPNYRVRVGDFMDKEEATLFCRKLRNTFTGAFIVRDDVNVPKYVKDDPEKEETDGFLADPDGN